VISGTLVSESLKVGAEISGVAGITLIGMRRIAIANASPNQPLRWTMIDFEAPDDQADALAAAFTEALDQPGWYVDFHTATDQYVVFSGRIFKYARGDAPGRAEAQAYALKLGVPEAQIDWPE
jgi:Lon protease-like protein